MNLQSEWSNTTTGARIYQLYYNIKFLQLKHLDSDMFQPFSVGHHQGVCQYVYKM